MLVAHSKQAVEADEDGEEDEQEEDNEDEDDESVSMTFHLSAYLIHDHTCRMSKSS